ncbi:hypothetical protein WG219_04385 [Ectopseudomonas mendocina]|uniref:Uncharacterized protein n=1 Tax=Ectopseudomonas mendocina TaxID=300 RepID=A0ABZ2RNI2_ECTME
MGTPSQAVQVCETLLRLDLEYNQTRKIWPSINCVIERMLARQNELIDAYEELHTSLAHRHRALESFFDVLTSMPVAWSPDKITKARQTRKDLTVINSQIAAMADSLAQLLTRRNELKETSGFSCETFHHVLDVVELAAESEGNHLFEWHVKEHLDALRYQYDIKYWPPLSMVVAAVGENARNAEVYAADLATASATESPRSGLSDFLKAFLARIEDNSSIPRNFKMSDNTLASLVNCALDLDADKLIDAEYVRRFRQRERKRQTGS